MRTIEAKRFPASQSHTHDGIKSDEVIHVRMGDKDVVGPQKTGGAQRVVLSQVEEQCALRPSNFHIDPGIAKTVVHEVAGKRGSHRGSQDSNADRTAPYTRMTS